MKILGIETSCDETSAAVVEDGRRIRSNVISSQVELHARYGGIVPEVASRQHLLQILPIVRQAMEEAETGWDDLDAIAVTVGPGLAGSLLVGVNAAKAIALGRGLPLVAVNHLEAHIYANWLDGDDPDTIGTERRFPLVCLIASGGHTDLVLMRGHGEYRLLGRTRDDAAGEAFDKVARILGLGYPGGPAVQRAAEEAAESLPLPRAWLRGTDDFSFSGVKTAALHLAQDQGVYPPPDDEAARLAQRAIVQSIAAGFQESVVDVLVEKTAAAAARHGAREVLLAGGVAANGPLRQRL
ncbi:MAG: tRNA (adenosine(37)-N6)-threonylcarbamoyltransferase complex transferase subunit TsaD, partial [Dehalococcoidia bacterium]